MKVLTMNNVTVITPYLFEGEIVGLKRLLGWEINSIFEKDHSKIGSDLMYQKLWKKAAPKDVFIMHADMAPKSVTWLKDVLEYVKKYPEAGLVGCKLLYPATGPNGKQFIQSAGGKFTDDGHPQHFGSGLNLFTGKAWKALEEDEGQYDFVREVAWTTFGGVYIRREVIDQVGDFDSRYEWSYNRDVDYCLEARKRGWKIYQVPVAIDHFESKDNNRIRNDELNQKEVRNLKRLQDKWQGSELYKTIDTRIL
jgi:GT2 family glycosyltransferase